MLSDFQKPNTLLQSNDEENVCTYPALVADQVIALTRQHTPGSICGRHSSTCQSSIYRRHLHAGLQLTYLHAVFTARVCVCVDIGLQIDRTRRRSRVSRHRRRRPPPAAAKHALASPSRPSLVAPVVTASASLSQVRSIF